MRVSVLLVAAAVSMTWGCLGLGSDEPTADPASETDPETDQGNKEGETPYKAPLSTDVTTPAVDAQADAEAGTTTNTPEDAGPVADAGPGGDASDASASDANDAAPPKNDAAGDSAVPPPPPPPPPPAETILRVRAGDAMRIPTIQEAVNRAKNGDTIQVAAGTYTENVLIQNKALTLLGGYTASFSARNTTANVTTIRGSSGQSVLRVLAEGKVNVVDGFTITGGTGNPGVANSGAGIYCVDGDATFSHNRIIDNRTPVSSIHMTDTRGGGIVANGSGSSRVRILENVIEGNVSGRGAGIASSGLASVIIQGNTIRNNRGHSDHGGGLFINSPDALITGNVVEGNEIGPLVSPYGWGGGVYVHSVGTVARLSYNIITGNKAITAGSGVFIDNGARASLSHELIFKNRCTEAGGAAILVDSTDSAPYVGSIVTIDHSTITAHVCNSQYQGDGILIGGSKSTATVTGSIFFNNGTAPQFNFGRTAEGPPAVSSTFTSDPFFVNASGNDFRLQQGSPASGYGAL